MSTQDSHLSARAEAFRLQLIATAKGRHGAKDMDREAAREALAFLLSDEAHPAQIGAFLTAMRFKGSRVEEMMGFLDAMEGEATLIHPRVDGLLNCNGPYDGRKHALHLSLPAAIVAAAAGVPVIMHSGADLPPKNGVTTGRLLDALGVAATLEPAAVQQQIEQKGFGHLAAARYLHGVERLKPIRQVLFYRSFLHACEVLLNPAGAQSSLVGAAHATFLQRFAEAQGLRGIPWVLAVQGVDGSDEVPMRAVPACEWHNGELREYTLSPTNYGLPEQDPLPCPDLDESARMVRALLQGERVPASDAFIYNAGIRIWLGGRTESIHDGIELARELIAGGAAAAKLEQLRG